MNWETDITRTTTIKLVGTVYNETRQKNTPSCWYLSRAQFSRLLTGRHRWVVYKDLSWPLGQEATAIAPDWHGDRYDLCYYRLHASYQFLSVFFTMLQVGYIACTMCLHLM